tara:strand:+ start:1407 stop:1874 length:468 start_codon:yes stop_codon:yes gene_type:complete
MEDLTLKCCVCKGFLPVSHFWKATKRKRGYQDTCKHCCRDYARSRYHNDPAFKAMVNSKGRQHRKNRPEYYTQKAAERKARVGRQTPSWLTLSQKKEILDMYSQAKLKTEETGIPHHVDHVVPLRGKVVSGLHVPWNLQVITAEENMRKSAKFEN